MKPIPIIDLFAGPGGLGEGFSALRGAKGDPIFDVRLSIEKDAQAVKTLRWRAFYREFVKRGEKPPEVYYEALRATCLKEREDIIEKALADFPEGKAACLEAQEVELGAAAWPSKKVDELIKSRLKSAKNWVLIGGPPCQAYSNAGRGRVGGISSDDHRVYLYKEYLRIIKNHGPSVFVMENVQGLLSAKVNEERVFDWVKKDLALKGEYTLHSFVGPVEKDTDFLIKSENYGVPQMRHRVILLGIRKGMRHPGEYLKSKPKVGLSSILEDLPKIRSGVSKEFIGLCPENTYANGRPARLYKPIKDSQTEWNKAVEKGKSLLANSPLGSSVKVVRPVTAEVGAEFIPSRKKISVKHPLQWWLYDGRLKGAVNHQSRSHLRQDLYRYLFATVFTQQHGKFPRMKDYEEFGKGLLPVHLSALSGKFADRFRVQMKGVPATTVTSHISKDGHYFIHYDPNQCRSLTVREAARIQTFPDNYLFRGSRTQQYHQVGNAVPPYLAYQLASIVRQVISKQPARKSGLPN